MDKKFIFPYYSKAFEKRPRSSAGEHYLHTVGVTGSIPVAVRTGNRFAYTQIGCFFLWSLALGQPMDEETHIFSLSTAQ